MERPGLEWASSVDSIYLSGPITKRQLDSLDKFKRFVMNQTYNYKLQLAIQFLITNKLPQLKDSHISLSHEEAPQYSTSYNSLFYKKDADPQGLAPKLQTSSLPLGTFSRYVARR